MLNNPIFEKVHADDRNELKVHECILEPATRFEQLNLTLMILTLLCVVVKRDAHASDYHSNIDNHLFTEVRWLRDPQKHEEEYDEALCRIVKFLDR